MKLTIVLCGVGAALLAACTPQGAAPETTEAQLVARGQYLVINVAGCNDCHTPMGPAGPDMSRSLQGADLAFAPIPQMPWAPRAPAIAGIPSHYTREQFAHFLQTGERPNGVPAPLPPMPAYRMNEDDARAVTAYVASLSAAPAAPTPAAPAAPAH